jgi:hypothetical protein
VIEGETALTLIMERFASVFQNISEQFPKMRRPDGRQSVTLKHADYRLVSLHLRGQHRDSMSEPHFLGRTAFFRGFSADLRMNKWGEDLARLLQSQGDSIG